MIINTLPGGGFVRLIESMGNDLSIVRAARVSYNADWRAGTDDGSDVKLIKYLMRNHHTTPFEMVEMTFEVKAPIFVFRQWHRHRTWNFNEISARYTTLDEGFYVPEVDKITTQSADNKQARTDEQHPEAEAFQSLMNGASAFCLNIYEGLIAAGCPRELARTVLPLSTYSRMFAKIDLHNLMNFLRLRMHAHAQYEIRIYAEALHAMATHIAPITMNAFDESILANQK